MDQELREWRSLHDVVGKVLAGVKTCKNEPESAAGKER